MPQTKKRSRKKARKRSRLPLVIGLAAIAAALALVKLWPHQPAPAPKPIPAPAPAAQKEITLYFPNKAYVASGDETLPHFLPEKRKIPAGDVASLAALRALQKGPENADATRVIKEGIKILGVETRDATAYVDLSRTGLSGGSLEEALLVQGVVKTLTGLPGIEAVQFLIDGEETDTLMGHMTTDKPFTAADFS